METEKNMLSEQISVVRQQRQVAEQQRNDAEAAAAQMNNMSSYGKQLNIAAGGLHADEWKDENVEKVKSVLQFFGWCRVWIFLLVTLGTFLFLSMTNELVKTTSIGNVFNSQVLVFALVLYLANVGYDVVREMLPAEFQTYETDETRFWVIVLYVIYFSINQAYYTENFLGHEK